MAAPEPTLGDTLSSRPTLNDSTSQLEFPTDIGHRKRRNLAGTPVEAMYGWDLEPLDRIESTFAVQMHIQNQLRRNPIDLNEVIALPPDQDPAIWQYEQLRAICLDLNYLVVIMAPECTPSSCPEMRAGEWQYLCAAHPSPQTCPAIDYIVHTLDGATALLNSSKYFPSRISILDSSMKHFQSIARRLYRIFAHAWFHHRDKFDEFENESRLYGRFILFTTHHFKLIPDKLISIPA